VRVRRARRHLSVIGGKQEIETNCWLRVRHETLVGKSDKERRLSHSGIACRAPRRRGVRTIINELNKWARRTGDDELEDVIPVRSGHYV
jgi:hypothetical protein